MHAFFDFLLAEPVENPLYARESQRPSMFRKVLRILVGFALAVLWGGVLLGLALVRGWADEEWAALLQLLIQPAFVLLGYVPPALAAMALTSERTSGTLESLMLSPYPRERMMLGLVVGRMCALTWLLKQALPACLAGGFIGGYWFAVHPPDPAAAWGPAFIPLGVLAGALAWALYAASYWFSICCGAWASVVVGSTGGAIAVAYLLDMFLPQVIGCCGGLLAVPLFMSGGSLPVVGVSVVLGIAILFGFYFGVSAWLWRNTVKRLDADEWGG